MQANSDPFALTPPPEPGRGRALGLSLIAHLLLGAALAWGVAWKSDTLVLSAEAELWSPTVQQAAPKLEEPPPPPPPPPAPTPTVKAPPPAPVNKDADIALKREQDKKKLAEEQKKRDEAERKKKLAAEEARKAEEAKKAEAKKKLEQQKLEQQKAELAQKKKEAADKASKDKAREQAEAKKLDDLRQENLRRIAGLAGATGGATATGTAAKSSGPSDSYAGRLRARIRPNIVFTEDVPGNPVAEVEVRMAPDGTITSRRITKSSGIRSWDDAVLRALDRTEVLPRDSDGRVHSPLLMEFKPKD